VSESNEQMDKKIVWQSHIQNAKDQLSELEKARIKFNDSQNKSKEKVIKELAQALEDNGMPIGLISEEIIRALADEGYGVTKQYINRCLDMKYKTKLYNSELEEPETSFQDHDKNVPEQKAMTVNNTGYEAIEDIHRHVEPASEIVKNLQKKIADVVQERDSLSNEVQVLKEKTQPEMFKEIQERFYDKPGLLKGDQVQKVNETAGKNIVKMLERYNSIFNDAAVAGQPIPVGLYVIAKPEMVLVPVRFTIDFEKKRVDISLWEKKLT
jgi:hypothetical protein